MPQPTSKESAVDARQIEEARVIALLPQAQQGDEQAVYDVAMYVFRRWKTRIRGFYSLDPAYDREDIEDAFLEGILKALPLGVHERPNPLWHLSERGYWNVGSFVRSIRNRPIPVQDDIDQNDPVVEQVPDDEEDMRTVVISQLDAGQRVIHILANADLRGNTKLAIEAILAGEVGDPTELGFNKRLADYLEVSPQRASQVMAELEAASWRASAGDEAA